MKVEQKAGIVHIKDTAESVVVFLEKVSHEYKSFQGQNIILDLTHNTAVTNADINLFQQLSDKHRATKKSFVIVAKNINYNEIPETIQVVPTNLEAHDIIEIEEIERDLGF